MLVAQYFIMLAVQ